MEDCVTQYSFRHDKDSYVDARTGALLKKE